MPRLPPTGRARVYRTGSHDYTEMPLEEAVLAGPVDAGAACRDVAGHVLSKVGGAAGFPSDGPEPDTLSDALTVGRLSTPVKDQSTASSKHAGTT